MRTRASVRRWMTCWRDGHPRRSRGDSVRRLARRVARGNDPADHVGHDLDASLRRRPSASRRRRLRRPRRPHRCRCPPRPRRHPRSLRRCLRRCRRTRADVTADGPADPGADRAADHPAGGSDVDRRRDAGSTGGVQSPTGSAPTPEHLVIEGVACQAGWAIGLIDGCPDGVECEVVDVFHVTADGWVHDGRFPVVCAEALAQSGMSIYTAVGAQRAAVPRRARSDGDHPSGFDGRPRHALADRPRRPRL